MEDNRDNIPIFQKGKVEAYRSIRFALGRHNDERRSVVELVTNLAEANPKPLDKEEECQHDNWTVLGGDDIGKCTCLDCGEVICICNAFNRLRERILNAIGERK